MLSISPLMLFECTVDSVTGKESSLLQKPFQLKPHPHQFVTCCVKLFSIK